MSNRKVLPPPNTTDVLSRRFSMDAESAVPRVTSALPPTADLDDVAFNPLNTRDLTSPRTRAKIGDIAKSMKLHGQLASCAVVHRESFLGIFPEYETQIGIASFVQVNGACRRAAAIESGRPDLKIDVMDELAASRQAFLGATSAENIDRGDYDPIEEALAVELLVKECGSGTDAAAQLAKTPAWVTQRRNLLKLEPEVQTELRSGALPLRTVRDWHKAADGSVPAPREEQLAKLEDWRRAKTPEVAVVDPADGDPGAPEEEQPKPARPTSATARPSRTAAAIQRLGGTPPKIAQSLRSELTVEDIRALVALLTEAL